MIAMADDNSDDEGHEKDADENLDDYVDRQFSRDGIISVFIGLSAGKIVESVVAITAPTAPAKLVAWTLVFPSAIAFAWYWPYFERRFAEYLPWMDAEAIADNPRRGD